MGIHAVRCAPDGHLPEQAGARAAARGCPGGWSVGSAGLFSDVVGQVGNELGSWVDASPQTGLICSRTGMSGATTAAARDRLPQSQEVAVKDGGHVASGGEVTAKSSIVEMAERVVAARFGGEVEEMGSQGGPGRFAGEPGNVLVDPVEVGNNLGSEEVFGGGVKAVGVPLDSVEQPGSRITELTQGRRGGGRANRRGPGSAVNKKKKKKKKTCRGGSRCGGRRRRRLGGRGGWRAGPG